MHTRVWNDYVGRTKDRYPTAAMIQRVAKWLSHSVTVIVVVGLMIAMPSNLWIAPFAVMLAAIVVHAWASVFLADRMLSMCVGTDLFDLAATKVDRMRVRAIAVTALIAVTVVLMAIAAHWMQLLR